jgi:hypothetical protein
VCAAKCVQSLLRQERHRSGPSGLAPAPRPRRAGTRAEGSCCRRAASGRRRPRGSPGAAPARSARRRARAQEEFLSAYGEQLAVAARQEAIQAELEACGEDMERMAALLDELQARSRALVGLK